MPVGGAGHGGGHEGISSENMWEKKYVGGNLKEQVHKGDTKGSNIPPKIQRDALEDAIEKDAGLTTIEDESPSQRTGEGSKNFVYSKNANNPRLPQDNAASSNPPRGSGGTGNPFFAYNPMVTFFTEFLQMIQMQEKMEKLANQFTVTDSRMIMGMAKDQAKDILGAADAQQDMYEKQAISSFVQAGVSGAMTVATAVGGVFAKEEASEELDAQAEDVKSAQTNLRKAQDDDPLNDGVETADGVLKAKQAQLTKLQKAGAGELEPEEGEMTLEKGDKTEGEEEIKEGEVVLDNKAKADKKKQQEIAKMRQKNDADVAKNDKDIKDTDDEINQLDKELQDPSLSAKQQKQLQKQRSAALTKKNNLTKERANLRVQGKKIKDLQDDNVFDKNLGAMTQIGKDIKQAKKELEDLGKPETAVEEDTQKELNNRLKNLEHKKQGMIEDQESKIQNANKDLEKSQVKLSQSKKVRDANDHLQAENGKYQQMRQNFNARAAQNLQSKPWFMIAKGLQEGFNQGMQGMAALYQAKDTMTAAQWEAQKTEIAAYQQIMQSAMGSAQEVYRDCYQQANSLADTLAKMSDQESQSMRWSA